ncbi:hypothetical protein P7C73_g3098, partial [Tremellales sp. Uapishka_1]
MPHSRIDLSTLPREFLENYPYPTFVLVVPIPPRRELGDENDPPPSDHVLPFTRSTHSDIHPFEAIWSNVKWRNLSQGKTLLDCLSMEGAREFGDWISGAREARDRERGPSGSASVAPTTFGHDGPRLASRSKRDGRPTTTTGAAPEGFWEAENPPYEDRSATSDPGSSHSTGVTGVEGSTENNGLGTSSLLVELVTPGKVVLELTKTTLPIWQNGSDGDGRKRMETHSYTVITSTPSGGHSLSMATHQNNDFDPIMEEQKTSFIEKLSIAETPPQPTPKTTILFHRPHQGTPLRMLPGSTPTDEKMALDLPLESPGSFTIQPLKPLIFNRDGTVSRQIAPDHMNLTINGKSMDVHVLMETTDWSQTPLGPREFWPQSLKTIEIWASIGPLSELVLSGTPVYKEDDFLLFKQLPHQGTRTYEMYHSWMWVPVVQEDGSFGGLWNATIDTTKKVLAERRLIPVREMGERTSIARTMKELDEAVIEILSANPKDVPFAALYHVERSENDERTARQVVATKSDTLYSNVILRLGGCVGIPDKHPSTPSTLRMSITSRSRDFRSPGNAAFSTALLSPTMSHSSESAHPGENVDSHFGAAMKHWPIKEALETKRLVLVEDCSSLIKDFPVRVWDELPDAAVVVPIANDSDEGVPHAVLVVGLSVRRPFDDDYEAFIHVLRLQLASGLAAVRSYEAERQMIDELGQLDRAKSLLFSNISHELRTPLTLVSGPLDDLLRETPEGPRRESLVMARRNVRRLTRLVSTLMDVSRLEAGRLKGSFHPVVLGVFTRDLAALFRAAIEKNKLSFVVDCDTSRQNTFVDPEHWEKIVFNLIGNALKYTMQGHIHVNLTYGANEAVFSVGDSGVGIPSSDLGLVGERFHRVASVSRSHEGTGIGLALVKELIKLHAGTLEIDSHTKEESADGSHGSVFRVRIPLGTEHIPEDSLSLDPTTGVAQMTYGQGIVDEAMQWNRDRDSSSVDSASESGSGANSGESSGQGSRGLDPSTLYFKKEDVVMLVDDSYDTRRYMRSIFAPFCTVVEARDGKEAVEMITKSQPDLIVSDIMMPNLDGFGLLHAIRGSKGLRLIPIILLTARGGDEATVNGIMAGADDYLAKPFNARELIARAHMQLQMGKRRKHLEDAFEERTAELRTLSQYLPVGIFRCSDDGTFSYANEAWYRMSSYPTGKEVTNWGDYIAEPYKSTVQNLWDRMLQQNTATETTEWQWTNGRWVTTRIIRLDVVAPGLKGILGCVTDITERKHYEEAQRLRVVEAEERRLEAEEAKRQQELLIDITSCVDSRMPGHVAHRTDVRHEIRNPISSLMQCSALVKTNVNSLLEQFERATAEKVPFVPTQQLVTTMKEDLEALESIYQCGLSQERISNDVLSLGRIQLDMLQMFDVDTDIREEAQKVVSIFQNEARMKRISLVLKIGESIDRLGINVIKIDPVRLGQVVTNLLSNGIRFTSTSVIRQIELSFDLSFEPPADSSCVMPEGSTLTLSTNKVKDDMPIYLYVAVKDTGPGLTPKELDMLFQRFSQVSPKTHTIFGGSGLGLFVCRKITDLMGGRIEVASEHGKGSTFRFFVEARTSQTQKRQSDEASRSSRSPLKKRNTGRTASLGPRPHVLIVEDNLINQTVLMRQLKHVGLTCEVANNGLEALEKIRKSASIETPSGGQPYDCVLMDLEMPVMDGLTAVKHIREEEAAGKLSLSLVIALTGNARQGQIDEAKAAGMDEVVIKPYRLDDLLVKIEEMMRVRQSDRESSDIKMQ